MKRDNPCHPARPSFVLGLAVAVTLALVAGCGSGALSSSVRQEIGAQVLKQRRPMAACYKKALKRNRALSKADLTLVFTVDPDSGAFRNVDVQRAGGGQDPLLQQCVARRAQGLRVAQAPDKPVLVSYPLSFSVRRR